MTQLESTATIEATVGVRRHPTRHIARVVTAEDRVYILHSDRCLNSRANSTTDLRDCMYSKALDRGLIASHWQDDLDRAVVVIIDILTGRLEPTSVDITALAAAADSEPKRPMNRRAYAEAKIEQNRIDGLPVAKYTLVVEITANSHEELADRIHGLDMNWYHHHSQYAERDEIDSTDGTTSVLLVHSNPTQTPESYREELTAWSGARREARRREDNRG
jgi:hypothetical protein